jgi:dihydroflavonol-4-reductase
MLWKVGSGKVKYVVDYSSPTVDIRDVAEAALLAEKHGRTGERYIIANEFISQRDFCTLAATACGNKPPRVVPLPVAYTLAWIVEHIFKLLGRRDYLVSTNAVFLSNVFREMDNSKARIELHWQPRPIAETIKDALAWYAHRESRSTS